MRYLLPLAAALVVSPAWCQHGLHKIWETHPYDAAPVWALGFSDDGTRLAIGAGGLEPGSVGRVLVISVDQPRQILGRTDYTLPSRPRPNRAALPILPKGASAESYYAARWTPGDTSALNLGAGGLWRIENTRDIVAGASPCRLVSAEKALICSDRQNGGEIRLSAVVVSGPLSVGGTRVAISELEPHHRPEWVARTFDTNGYWLSYKRRLIWDFHLNSVIASWTAEQQKVPDNGWSCDTCGILRAPFALSPDGKLLAEGANGIVRLFRVE